MKVFSRKKFIADASPLSSFSKKEREKMQWAKECDGKPVDECDYLLHDDWTEEAPDEDALEQSVNPY